MSSKPMHLVRYRRLLRNFPRGHFRAGGGGTVSNWVMKRTQFQLNGHDKSPDGWSPSPVPQSLDWAGGTVYYNASILGIPTVLC